MFSAQANIEGRSGITEADLVSGEIATEIQTLPKESPDRANLIEAVISYLKIKRFPLYKVLTLTALVLERLHPLADPEKEKLAHLAVEKYLPYKPENRAYLLRVLALEKAAIDWQSFITSENWKAVAHAAPLLAADILVYAGEFDLAREQIIKQLCSGHMKRKDFRQMMAQWRDREGWDRQPQKGLALFLHSLTPETFRS